MECRQQEFPEAPFVTLRDFNNWKESIKHRYNVQDQPSIASNADIRVEMDNGCPEDKTDEEIYDFFRPDVFKKFILPRSSVYMGYVNGDSTKRELFHKALDKYLFDDLEKIRYTTRAWEMFLVHPTIKTSMMINMSNGVVAYANQPSKPYTWSIGAKEFAKIRYESNLLKCVQYLLAKLYKKRWAREHIRKRIPELVHEELGLLKLTKKIDRGTASYISDVAMNTCINEICNDINGYSRSISQKLHSNFKLYHLYLFVFGFVPRYLMPGNNYYELENTTLFSDLPRPDRPDYVIPKMEDVLMIFKNGRVIVYDWLNKRECECDTTKRKLFLDIDTISSPTFKSIAEPLWFAECRNKELQELLYRSQAPHRYIITERKEGQSSSSSSSDGASTSGSDSESGGENRGKKRKQPKDRKERNDKYAHAKRMRELQIKREVQRYDRKLKEMVKAEEMRDRLSVIKGETKNLNACDKILEKVNEHQKRTRNQLINAGDYDEGDEDFGFTREIKRAVANKKIELNHIKNLLVGYSIYDDKGDGGSQQHQRVETITNDIIAKAIRSFKKELNMITDQAKNLYNIVHSKILQLVDYSTTPELLANAETEYAAEALYAEPERMYDLRARLNETLGDLGQQINTNEDMRNLVRIEKEASAIESLKEKIKSQVVMNKTLTETQHNLIDRLQMTIEQGVEERAKLEATKKMNADLKKMLESISSITFKTLREYETQLTEMVKQSRERDKTNKAKMEELTRRCNDFAINTSDRMKDILRGIEENINAHKETNAKYAEWLNGLETSYNDELGRGEQQSNERITSSVIGDKKEILGKMSEPYVPISGCKGLDEDEYYNLVGSGVKVIKLGEYFRKADIDHKVSLDVVKADSKALYDSWESAIDTVVPCRTFFTTTSHRTKQLNTSVMCTDYALPFLKFIYKDTGVLADVGPQVVSKDELFTHVEENVRDIVHGVGGKLYATVAVYRSNIVDSDRDNDTISLISTERPTIGDGGETTIFHTLED